MTKIIDGKAIAAKIRGEIAVEVKKLEAAGTRPGLAAVVLVGEDPASKVYVSMKEKACSDAGIFSDEYKLHAEISEADLLALIDRLNDDPKIHGISCNSLSRPTSILTKCWRQFLRQRMWTAFIPIMSVAWSSANRSSNRVPHTESW